MDKLKINYWLEGLGEEFAYNLAPSWSSDVHLRGGRKRGKGEKAEGALKYKVFLKDLSKE